MTRTIKSKKFKDMDINAFMRDVETDEIPLSDIDEAVSAQLSVPTSVQRIRSRAHSFQQDVGWIDDKNQFTKSH